MSAAAAPATRPPLPLHGPHRLRRLRPHEEGEAAPSWRPQRAFLTGATSDPGIGREVLYGLLDAGLRVVTVARSEARAAQLRVALTARFGAEVPVEICICDLEQMAAVQRLCDEVVRDTRPFDLIIHCVGAMFARFETTGEGRERSLAINAVAPWLMSLRLTDAQMLADDGRIVHASSDLHRQIAGMWGLPGPRTLDRQQLERAHSFQMERDYGLAKLAALQLDSALQARLVARGARVRLFSYNPGWTHTQLGRDFARRGPLTRFLAHQVFPRLAASASYVAQPLLSLALDPELTHAGGGYYTRFRRVSPAPAAHDMRGAEELWHWLSGLADAAWPRGDAPSRPSGR